MHNERSVARIAHPTWTSSIHWDWDTSGLWKYYTLQCQGLRNATKCTCKPFDIGGKEKRLPKGTMDSLYFNMGIMLQILCQSWEAFGIRVICSGRPAVNTGKTAPVDLNWLQVASLTLRCVLIDLSWGIQPIHEPSPSFKDWKLQLSIAWNPAVDHVYPGLSSHFPHIKLAFQLGPVGPQFETSSPVEIPGRCLVVLRLRGLCAEALAGMAECSLKGREQTALNLTGKPRRKHKDPESNLIKTIINHLYFDGLYFIPTICGDLGDGLLLFVPHYHDS